MLQERSILDIELRELEFSLLAFNPFVGPSLAVPPFLHGNADSGPSHYKISQLRDCLESPKRVCEVQRSQHLRRTLGTPEQVSCKKDQRGSVTEAPTDQ